MYKVTVPASTKISVPVVNPIVITILLNGCVLCMTMAAAVVAMPVASLRR